MIGSTRQVQVYAYGQPTDLRRGYDGLSALVRHSMGRDPVAGDMYAFISRNRKRAKVLYWDGTGLCILSKRLERGHFSAPWHFALAGEVTLTLSELTLLLEGSDAIGRVSLSPKPFLHKKTCVQNSADYTCK